MRHQSYLGAGSSITCFTSIVFLQIILCTSNIHCVDNVQVKIVEAPAVSHFPSFQGDSSKQLTLRVEPSLISGPLHLQQLKEECFMARDKGYEYRVCPFHNVTQREERVGWNSFHGVLGVWHEWIIENDTIAGMHFTTGESCGSVDREAKVMLNCSTSTKIHSVSETKTCSYTIWLDTPLACFKGAMQVYHLLNDEQLKKWDSFDEEYFREEITFQGLTKRRRKLLTQIGLLTVAKKPELSKSDAPGEVSAPPLTVKNSELELCEQDKEKLERQLKEMQTKVDELIKQYPTVANTLGFVTSNLSVTETSPKVLAHNNTLAGPNSLTVQGVKVTKVQEQEQTTTSVLYNSNSQSNVTNNVAIPENVKD